MLVLMGYGFCIPNNPRDSISLKLPHNPTLFSITRTNLAPIELVQVFRDTQSKTWREKLMTDVETRKNRYDGLEVLLQALIDKVINVAGNSETYDSPAGKYAAIYRDGQRELYGLAYNFIVSELQKIIEERGIISLKKAIRGQRGNKRTKLSDDQFMTRWISTTLELFEYPEREQDSQSVRSYLELLVNTFYDKVDWFGYKPKIDENCKYILKRLKKRGTNASLEIVRIAREIWDNERTIITKYPDAIECFEEFKGDEEGLKDALEGEQVDIVVFMDELKDPGEVHWDFAVLNEVSGQQES